MANNTTIALISAGSALVGAIIGGSFSVVLEFVKALILRKDKLQDKKYDQIAGYRDRVKILLIDFLQLTDPDLTSGQYDMKRISRIIAELQLEFTLNDEVERQLNQCLNKMYLIANGNEDSLIGEPLRLHSALIEAAKHYIHARRAQQGVESDALTGAD